MTDDVQATLAAATPLTDDELAERLSADTLAELARSVARRGARSRRLRRRVAWAAALAALVLPATSLGVAYSTHTGWFGSGSGEDRDRSEFLRVDAPDF